MKFRKGDKVLYRANINSDVFYTIQGVVKHAFENSNTYSVEYFVKSSNKWVYSYFKESDLEYDRTLPKKRFLDSPYS